MEKIRIALVGTRFPENIGAVARASANFGPSPIYLIRPERWDKAKAGPMATSQALALLDKVIVCESLAEAVGDCTLVAGTTARTGGWRRQIISPRVAAKEIAAVVQEEAKVALVFGPEDRGLLNEEISRCNRLVNIPSNREAKSLNLAQAVLLMLYECRLAAENTPQSRSSLSRRVTHAEMTLFYEQLKRTLLAIDFLRQDNPDYFFLPLAGFFDRADVRRHELDMFMGMLRQINRLL